MAITIEPIRGVMVGSFGQTITLIVVDEDGVVQDVSGYTDITVISRSPYDLKTVTSSGSYTSDGTDGSITYSYVSGDIDRSGDWKVQAEFSTASETFKTRPTTMDVGMGLR